MQLAASMSARGFGRRETHTKSVLITRITTFLALTFIVAGVAMLLISNSTQLVDLSVLIIGFVFAFISFKLSSGRVIRTQYIVLPWRSGDAVLLSLSAAVIMSAFGGLFSR
jgi:hypothetical protein